MNILNLIGISNLQVSKCMDTTAVQNVCKDDRFNYEKEMLQRTCILILGGGQSTRLGCQKPKGIFDIEFLEDNINKTTTLFKLHFEKIETINKKYKMTMKVIIMCSDFTLEDTQNYIKSIYKHEVKYIKQGNEVCRDIETGKALYKNKFEFQISPNGNGGVFNALEKYGIFEYFTKESIDVLNIIGIDNAKANPLDLKVISQFYHSCDEIGSLKYIESKQELNYDIISKGVIREDGEQAGIFEKIGDKRLIREYSEFSEEYKKTIPENALINICHHYFSVDFLRKNKQNFSALEFHVAKKKIPFYDFKKNEFVRPIQENGLKSEKFIFDIFNFTDATRNIEHTVSREEFLPLKNLHGEVDSVLSVKRGLSKNIKN